MNELKPCPFCEEQFEIVTTAFDDYMVEHDVDCPMYMSGENGEVYAELEDLITALNTRPIEDMLKARAEAAEAELDALKERTRVLDRATMILLDDGELMFFALPDFIDLQSSPAIFLQSQGWMESRLAKILGRLQSEPPEAENE